MPIGWVTLLVRGAMLSLFRSLVVAALIFGLLSVGPLNLPAAMAAEKPVGVVVLSQNGYLAKEHAIDGVDVYPGDPLYTDAGGNLRVKVGTSQIYLLSSSAGSLARGEGKIQARLSGGTIGFSSTSADQLAIETNIAEIRPANDQRAYGQVTITSPTTITVAAYRGSLIVSSSASSSASGPGAADERTIREGESYAVSLVPDAGSPSAAEPPAPSPAPPAAYHIGHWHLVFTLAIAGGAALAGGLLYHHYETESNSTPQ
jgi:hypothetical protein